MNAKRVKRSTIILAIVTIISVIVLAFNADTILLVSIGGFQYYNEDSARPTDDKTSTTWYADDGKSWFKVDPNVENYCEGELYFDGETIPVYYCFEANYTLIVYKRDETMSMEENLKDDIHFTNGFYKTKKKKTTITLYQKKDNVSYELKYKFKKER